MDTIPKLTGNRCTCRGCGELFNSVTAFDAHRTGPADRRRCLTIPEMLEQGMVKNAAAFWVERLRDETRPQARRRGQISHAQAEPVTQQGVQA